MIRPWSLRTHELATQAETLAYAIQIAARTRRITDPTDAAVARLAVAMNATLTALYGYQGPTVT